MPSADESTGVRGHETPLQKVGTPKAVTISDEPETITPSQTPNFEPVGSSSPRFHRASVSGKRLSGRACVNQPTMSMVSLTSQISNFKLDSPSQDDDATEASETAKNRIITEQKTQAHASDLLGQVFQWLQAEKSKRGNRKFPKADGSTPGGAVSPLAIAKDATASRKRSDSDVSDGAFALNKLERILAEFAGSGKERASSFLQSHKPSVSSRRGSLFKKTRKGSTYASSDTDYVDGDVLVPSADVWLDNTKTMAYTDGNSGSEVECVEDKKKDKEHWVKFKQEIVRLAHTLKLKGWRRLPIEKGEEIDVERLSGALTNAVYVVAPPKMMPRPAEGQSEGKVPRPRKPPAKLLLRIYGAQVDHLIDRESELQILRRLARKRIGPRLLGCFKNGRFEEFFHARTLTAKDIRVPDTSKQIAKRMRELHDGIDLLEQERARGPFVWSNWDKWVDRCEAVITWLDEQILAMKPSEKVKPSEKWKERGFICGVEWPVFRKTVEKYRMWLDASCGGTKGIRNQLVFAHNDTQYGNLLRLEPEGESPLLHPANEHKQLVVIDFEYASANTPGLEFANHFTEWCYNYHSTTTPWMCNTTLYPNLSEQNRFIRSYVNHRPQFFGAASSTPNLKAQASPTIRPGASPIIRPGASTSTSTSPSIQGRSPGPSPSIAAGQQQKRPYAALNLGPPANPPAPGSLDAFTLARGPPSSTSLTTLANTAPPSQPHPFSLTSCTNYDEEEHAREQAVDKEVQRLLREVRLWRVANSAQWVAWGIVQAKVRGMDEALEARALAQGKATKKKLVSTPKPVVETIDDPPRGDGAYRAHLQSDLLTPEAQAMAADAHNKRPEDHVQEEEDMETEDDEFDYLAYAQSRAMFFWGDVLEMGLIQTSDLPGPLVEAARRIGF